MIYVYRNHSIINNRLLRLQLFGSDRPMRPEIQGGYAPHSKIK